MKILNMLLLLLVLPSCGLAATYYIDPVYGSEVNDGSSGAPWKSLQYLFDHDMIESREWDSHPYSSSSHLIPKNSGAPVKGGDTLVLRSGSYGELLITSYYNTAKIKIVAEQGSLPLFRNIRMRSSSNWEIAGVTVSPSSYPTDSFSTMIDLENHNWTGPISSITINGCKLFSVADSSEWSINDWNTKAKSGIGVDGTNMTISNNVLTNVNFGISVSASHSLIERNTIANFAGDGMRGLGDYTVFQYNTVKNCYDVNGNHDDGFQSWSVGTDSKVGTGVVTGIVLRGNTFINYEDVNQPFKGTLQGIGCFDGMFKDWIVERNIVKVDHWHGISLYGAINVIIRDNVVMDLNDQRPGPPWIYIHSHKNGTPPRNSTAYCNISPKILVSDGAINVTVENNTLSETGGPRNPKCPPLNYTSSMLPLLLNMD